MDSVLNKVSIYLHVTLSKLTIIPRARMGSKSIAHEAEGWMGYLLRGHEDERNNCFSKVLHYSAHYFSFLTILSGFLPDQINFTLFV